MVEQRLLVMGDNHGDTESLETVAEETEVDEFDYRAVTDFRRYIVDSIGWCPFEKPGLFEHQQ